MVWMSPSQARHKSVATNVEHWVTTTKGVLRMQFTVMQTPVLLEIQQIEHLLRSDHHFRELLVEGTQCHDSRHCKFILSTRCCCLVAQSKTYKALYCWMCFYTYVYLCTNCATLFECFNAGMGSLLDPVIDASHRYFAAAVQRRTLGVLRPHPLGEVISIHQDWVERNVFKFYMFVSLFIL